MARGDKPTGGKASRGTRTPAGKVELGYDASENYKARLVKGLLGVDLGEGYIVEVVNYRTKRVLRRELFEDSDDARDELAKIRDDIDSLTTEDFRKRYLQPPT
ncbi:MAG: hypothetical protein V1748_10820 [Actinomycetota bacterium]